MNQASALAGGMSHGPRVARGTQGAPLRAAAAPILFRRMPSWNIGARSETAKRKRLEQENYDLGRSHTN